MSLEDLSPELREKAKACKTLEELQELVKSESIELSADELDALAGGFDTARYVCPLKKRLKNES